MRIPSLALVILVLTAILASGSGSGVLAARNPAIFAPAGSRGALLQAVERPRKLAEAGSNGASSTLGASGKPAAAASSPPPTVFDADRMSKRRVRRGFDPIHNKC
ncbi:hypothetical protein BRADI_5g12375v3 [Brachypodium distachyon]|uniref:Uncharacterized protein n=1 Tax=Brachypodium distachyon TaxID=15368 RepID=A0A0Q3KS94_BRADI|nr:hypothetical protein BRADI_5g12375v3 [Brachypodium distachyon]